MLVTGCSKKKDKPPPILPAEEEDNGPAGPAIFEDVSATSGIKCTYDNGEAANHLAILESLGGGVGLIDFDGDGLLDVFLPAGGQFEEKVPLPRPGDKERVLPKKHGIFGHPCKLYRNLGNFKFEDVTDKVLRIKGNWPFSHGVAVCDYDCDGWPDLLVTGWERLVLFHNEPDPKDPGKRILVDVTEKAGLNVKGWSSSAAWGDLDGDGYPDLFVCYYTDWSFSNHPQCTYDSRTPDICAPKSFSGLPARVFLNNKDGTFADVSKKCGAEDNPPGKKEFGLVEAGPESSKALAVLIADLNLDGRPEVYVANDEVEKQLYINLSTPGKIKLADRALRTGTARDDRGAVNGSMGIDAADYNGTGLPSLIVTNFEGEKHALYHNDLNLGGNPIDGLGFTHRSARAGIAKIGLLYVGWGVGFVDLDNRGWEDLLIINGHVIRFPVSKGATKEQCPVLLRNQADGTFKQITQQGGAFFRQKHQGRGVALGDLDNDGKVDFVASIVNSNIAVARNVSTSGNHWLGIELKGKDNRDIVGARLCLEVAGRKLWRFCKGGGSYASARDPRHVLGLEKQTKPGRLTVHWPNGDKQEFVDLEADRYYRITQGDPRAVKR